MKRKKVILYNTHLSGLLQNGKEQIKKMQDTLKIVESMDDVVLLWRPHPLSKETLLSMNGMIYEDYCRIETEFQQSEKVIFDNSDDFHKAMAVSDAYYGDYSSLVPLYLLTGKPCMIQKCCTEKELQKKREQDIAAFNDVTGIVEYGEKVYFITNSCGALFELNMKNGEVICLGCGEKKTSFSRYAYGYGAICGDVIVFPPRNGENFLIYKVEAKKFLEQKITFNKIYENRYLGIFAGDDEFYILPALEKNLLKYEYNKKKLEIINEYVPILEPFCTKNRDITFYAGSAKKGSTIYVACNLGNVVLSFDINSKEWEAHEVGSTGMAYFNITFDGEKFWLLGDDKFHVYIWDGKNIAVETLEIDIEGFEKSTYTFLDILYSKGYIYLIPFASNMIVRIDTCTRKTECVKKLQSFPEIKGDWARYGNCSGSIVLENGNILVFLSEKKTICDIDGKTGEVRDIPLKFGNEELQRVMQQEYEETLGITFNKGEKNDNKGLKKDWIYNEAGYLNFERYLDSIKIDNIDNEQRQDCKKCFSCGEGNSGAEIYKKILEILE